MGPACIPATPLTVRIGLQLHITDLKSWTVPVASPALHSTHSLPNGDRAPVHADPQVMDNAHSSVCPSYQSWSVHQDEIPAEHVQPQIVGNVGS